MKWLWAFDLLDSFSSCTPKRTEVLFSAKKNPFPWSLESKWGGGHRKCRVYLKPNKYDFVQAWFSVKQRAVETSIDTERAAMRKLAAAAAAVATEQHQPNAIGCEWVDSDSFPLKIAQLMAFSPIRVWSLVQSCLWLWHQLWTRDITEKNSRAEWK